MPSKFKYLITIENFINKQAKEINFFYKNLISALIILLGILVYIFAGHLLKYTYNVLSQFYFYYFILQAIIMVNRVMNYLIIHTEKYFPFPVNKRDILFFNIISIMWDRNLILSILVFQLAITIHLGCDVMVKFILNIITFISTLLYYLSIAAIIIFLPLHVKENIKIYIGHLLLLIYIEGITRFSHANYLWDIYPFSGWIGSTVLAAHHDNYILVCAYFLGIVTLILLVTIVSIRFMYPRGKYVYQS